MEMLDNAFVPLALQELTGTQLSLPTEDFLVASSSTSVPSAQSEPLVPSPSETPVKKKGGRPKGSKNKPKDPNAPSKPIVFGPKVPRGRPKKPRTPEEAAAEAARIAAKVARQKAREAAGKRTPGRPAGGSKGLSEERAASTSTSTSGGSWERESRAKPTNPAASIFYDALQPPSPLKLDELAEYIAKGNVSPAIIATWEAIMHPNLAENVLPVIMSAFHGSFVYACAVASRADAFKWQANHIADGALYICVRLQGLVQSTPDLLRKVQAADQFSVEDVFCLLEVSEGVSSLREILHDSENLIVTTCLPEQRAVLLQDPTDQQAVHNWSNVRAVQRRLDDIVSRLCILCPELEWQSRSPIVRRRDLDALSQIDPPNHAVEIKSEPPDPPSPGSSQSSDLSPPQSPIRDQSPHQGPSPRPTTEAGTYNMDSMSE